MKLVNPWEIGEHAEKAYRAYERMVPAVWSLFADGRWWEDTEPYRVGCEHCTRKAFETLLNTDRRILEYLASGIVIWSDFTPPKRYAVTFRVVRNNTQRIYTALISYDGWKRIVEKWYIMSLVGAGRMEIMVNQTVDMSTNVDMTVRYLAQTVLDTLSELETMNDGGENDEED